MGAQSKADYQDAAYKFGIENLDNPYANIDVGYRNTRNGYRGEIQVALMYANKTLIIDFASGQMINFYTGSWNRGIIHQMRIR